MMNTFLSSDGKTPIYYRAWLPTGTPKAVLVICHGMLEHIERYEEFASRLNKQQIAVYGHDHLGHGHSILSPEDKGFFAEKDGNQCVVNDYYKMIVIASQAHPTTPLFLMGHSMGSFILRQLLHHRQLPALHGAIIMGTGHAPKALVQSGKALATFIAKTRGQRYKSDLLYHLALGSNSKNISPAPTGYEWLSRDEERVHHYIHDPFNGDNFTAQAYADMFSGMLTNYDPARLSTLDRKLPLLLVSGSHDPVGDNGKAVEALYKSYLEMNYKDVSLILYPEARHELLNENNRAEVIHDIINWLTLHY